MTAPKLGAGAVGTAAIAAGAVTADKLAEQIPASKLDRTGLDADLLDGQHAAAFAAASHDHSNARKKNSRVLVVAHDGSGDFPDPAAAMEAITDASATNPYLIKVLPGAYQVAPGWRPKSYVQVEGSGQDLTVIWSECPALTIGPPMVMAWALEGAEFRDLTLQMRTGGPGSVYSGVIIDSGSLRLSRVRVLCQSTGGGECAQAFEVRFGGQLVIEDSVVQTDGAGFRLFSYRPYIDTPVVVWVRGGEVDAPTGAVAVNAETGDLTRLYAAGAQFYGPLLYPGSVSPDVFKCVWCFDGNFAPILAP